MEKLISEYLPLAGTVVTLLAFLVSLITETIKNLGFLKNTDQSRRPCSIGSVVHHRLCDRGFSPELQNLLVRHRRFHPGRFHRQLCRDLWLGKIQQPLSPLSEKKRSE